MADRSAAPKKELRLALGLRGGVSLAVWIGGACAEIDELRRSTADGDGFWAELLGPSPYDRVVVDVMAGASAGGINGVVFSAAIHHGFEMSGMYDIWLEVGRIDTLRRDTPPWLSLLDGDGLFIPVLESRIRRIAATAGATAPEDLPPRPSALDLQLVTTLVEPVERPLPSPSDEQLIERRHTSRFHFRYDPGAAVPRDDLSGADATWRLAVAARATSSFPGAFEGSTVRSTRPAAFGTPAPLQPGPLADCRGVFSEGRGRDGATPTGSASAFDFVLTDGGIVDNIPLDKAIDAIVRAPADRATQRVLVYLHPTGPAPATAPGTAAPTDHDRRRQTSAVARGIVGARVQGESIAGDIADLDAHNSAVNLARSLRRATLDQLTSSTSTSIGTAAIAAARQAWPSYRAQRGAAESDELAQLLADPLTVLGDDPFPYAGDGATDDDRWRAPQARWTDEARNGLRGVASTAGHDALDAGFGPALLGAGVDAWYRVIGLLIEWARAIEPAGAGGGGTKARLYRLRSLVSEASRLQKLAWVVGAGLLEGDDPGPWVAGVRSFAERLLWVPSAVAEDAAGGADASGFLAEGCRRLQLLADGAAGHHALWALTVGTEAWGYVAAPPDGAGEPRSLDPAAGTTGLVDLGDVVARHVLDAVEDLRAAAAPLEWHQVNEPARLVHLVLARPGELATLDLLAALEVLCFPEYLLGSPGGDPIEFRRISAAAPTPLAPWFEALHRASIGVDPVRAICHIAPAMKLAGNELANFSAFLHETWRDNDWLWGRLDAVPTLVDLLLGGRADVDDAQRWALIGQRQRQIIAEHFKVQADQVDARVRDYRVGLETLNVPGHGDLPVTLSAMVSVAANVLKHNVPAPANAVAGPFGTAGRRVIARWLTPRGWPPSGSGGTAAAARPGPGRSRLPMIVAGLALVFAVAVTVAVIAADSIASLVVGAVIGIVAGPGLLAVVLWRHFGKVPTPPPRPSGAAAPGAAPRNGVHAASE